MAIRTTDGQPPRSVALVGFMATGKSKIGRLLAKRLDWRFVDTDRHIEQAMGRSIPDIFREQGEGAFREAERASIASLLAGDAQVLAVGGGAFVDPANREALNRDALTVWLDVPFELILPRLLRSQGRPLAANRDENELRALWDERRQYYAEAQVRIAVTNEDADATVASIITAMRSASV